MPAGSSSAAAALQTDISVSKATAKTSITGASSTAETWSSETQDLNDFTQPLRIESTKMTFEPRLTGKSSSLRSGAESPLQRGNSIYTATFDGGSSISSLEDQGIDTDILTDKMGVLELNLKFQQEITHSLHKSLSNLPAVNERLRNDTLEDCHGFSDVCVSRGGSITSAGGEVSSNMLEPLEEIEDENDYMEERTSKIKITNLAEILEAPDEEEVGETTANATTRKYL